ncbi:RmlC-like cupin domain-containing protein [Dactylonectria macrodidyma]|uniref:RmlC-like cupin domain-containing protein n=1 Tax=Dactylonectria macrodidyma TaxID=307937 RepID=A0A9P9DVJ8_9HYPO|nr:RmlC-like cupin domain-containing protein [Dactylonectria macrodidyma]
MVYCSGSIGILPGTNVEQVQGTVKDRARQAIQNLAAVLEVSGSTAINTPSAVKARTFLKQLLQPAHGQNGAKIHQPIGSAAAASVLLNDLKSEGPIFSDHSHRSQETITYVLEGSLIHQDSNGNKGILNVSDLQAMRAGSGIMYNETLITDPVTGRSRGIQL